VNDAHDGAPQLSFIVKNSIHDPGMIISDLLKSFDTSLPKSLTLIGGISILEADERLHNSARRLCPYLASAPQEPGSVSLIPP
jgi:hypothetical protein